MKRLLSWLTGALLMAGLLAGLILPGSVHADEDLVVHPPQGQIQSPWTVVSSMGPVSLFPKGTLF